MLKASQKAQKLADYCMNAQGLAYKELCTEYAPAPKTLDRAKIIGEMADNIARYFFANNGLIYDDIRAAADILTDNNAHIARRVLELVAL